MPKQEVWRDYVVRKYVRARSASEAISLSCDVEVAEVNEMKDKPEVANPEPCQAIGFHIPFDAE